MRELEQLFGASFPIESVADCRVRRAKVRGLAAIAVGGQPTSLSLVLADGRRLEASSRGPGPQQTAIQAVIGAITDWKASQTLSALASGMPVVFGDVELSPYGVRRGGRQVAWEEIAGFAVSYGGLLYDDAKGRLAGEIWLASVPFPDALCAVFAERLPGKDYERMGPGEGPRHGFFSITARTRVPGTFKYQLHLFFGVIPALLLLGGLYVGGRFVFYSVLARAMPVHDPQLYLAHVDAAKAAMEASAAAGAGVPPCPLQPVVYHTVLVAADRSTVSYAGHPGWYHGDTHDLSSSKEFFVWQKNGAEIRVVSWDVESRKIVCDSTGPYSGKTPEETAQALADGSGPRRPAPSASAPAPSASAAPEPPKKKKKRPKR